MPLIDNECYLLDTEEFESVHNFIDKNDRGLLIGKLSLEKGQAVKLGVDSLFASHIGIFGNTGSGKSYTLAKLYHELFKMFRTSENFIKKAKFFLIDFNGEYDAADAIIGERYKYIYRLSTASQGDRFPITEDTLYQDSFWKVVLEATEKTQTPFLKRALRRDRLSSALENYDSIKSLIKEKFLLGIDKNDRELGSSILIDFLSDLDSSIPGTNIWQVRDKLRENLQYHSGQGQYQYVSHSEGGYVTILRDTNSRNAIISDLDSIELGNEPLDAFDKLKLQFMMKYYDEIIKGYANREHLAPLLKRAVHRFDEIKKLIKVDNNIPNDRNFTIVSLKGVNVEMRKILPLLLCKQLYEYQKINSKDDTNLNIIVDEAHNILSESSFRESAQWKDYRLETFEEIIKEGRKFGVFLTLASQRPSDISPTIISQIHNFFLHRLINNEDIKAIEKTISYLDKVSFEYLPILPTGTCVVAGLSAQLPVIVDIDEIARKYEPDSKTRKLIQFWK